MAALKRLVPAVAVAASLVAGACNESTAPGPTDPATLATAVTGVSNTFTQNAVFQSLVALVGVAPALPVVAARPLRAAPQPGPASRAAAIRTRALLEQPAGRAPAAIQALFPANELGKTFQWDTTSPAGYRILDSTLAGAPSNGVRFRLYQVDTSTGLPTLPLQTTGNVDISDVSNAGANELHVQVHVGTQTAADYTITEVRTTTSVTLSAAGYVVDVVAGGTPVNFTLTHALALADSSLSTNYQLSGNGATASLVDSLSATRSTLDWVFTKGGSVEIVGTATSTTSDLTVKINGAVFATETGSNPPVGPNGQPLTSSQDVALVNILLGLLGLYIGATLVFFPGLLVFT
jgi:hypothetical protein